MDPLIPYGKQSISEKDIEAVIRVMRSDWLTQGPVVEQFEKTVARYCGSRFAVAVTNGTSALHLACLAAGLGPGDSLWTSPNTFLASANCALYCGASVDFVDIDPATYNLSHRELARKLVAARKTGSLPKVVVPVHFAGQSCDMSEIGTLAAEYGFTVIEDACHAIGGSYGARKIGCCTHSAMTVFSFHPVKNITTGEGGMIVTDREDLYEKLIRLRSHGVTRDPELMAGPSHGPWYYEQTDLGYNFRLSDIHAALGLSQLQRLDEFVNRRRHLAALYHDKLQNLPLTLPWQAPERESAWHLYVIRFHTHMLKKTHLQIFEELRAQGIQVNLHYIPVHMQPYYKQKGFSPEDFPEALRYYGEAITLPLFVELSEAQLDRVCETVHRVLA